MRLRRHGAERNRGTQTVATCDTSLGVEWDEARKVAAFDVWGKKDGLTRHTYMFEFTPSEVAEMIEAITGADVPDDELSETERPINLHNRHHGKAMAAFIRALGPAATVKKWRVVAKR